VKIERAGDLMFVTYFMVDWKGERVSPSLERCTECGNGMESLEAVVDESGMKYEGLVCHNCKRLVWLRKT
jgi:uncharacterized protein with PIN domain